MGMDMMGMATVFNVVSPGIMGRGSSKDWIVSGGHQLAKHAHYPNMDWGALITVLPHEVLTVDSPENSQ